MQILALLSRTMQNLGLYRKHYKVWYSIESKHILELYRQERKVWDSAENTKKFGDSIENNANCDSIDNK